MLPFRKMPLDKDRPPRYNLHNSHFSYFRDWYLKAEKHWKGRCRMKQNLHKQVLAALFAAICAVMTLVIQVPSPMQGYVNLGDCAVLLSAWILGPVYGGAAAGIGSMLADLMSGYAHYAPGTLIIKFLMAFTAAILFQLIRERRPGAVLPAQGISGLASGAILVSGYFAYASLWLGKGLAAAASIPDNIVQGGFGLIAAVLIYAALDRARVLARLPRD